MDLEAAAPGMALRAVGVPEGQVPDLTALLAAVEPEYAARVQELSTALSAQVGRIFERGSLFEPADFEVGPGRGAVPLLALLGASPTVDAHLRGRGIPDDVCRATLAEIGRQTSKTQRVQGWAGVQDASWVETVFRGGFTNVGRLQYELVHDDARGEYVVNTHIPAGGPLRPDDVAESLRRGREVMAAAFPEFGPITTVVCNSWLLDPQLEELLPGSNIVAFGRLWELEKSAPGDDDGLYFVFDVPRGNGDRVAEILPGLTANSRLQAALLDLWRSGGGLRRHRGHLTLR